MWVKGIQIACTSVSTAAEGCVGQVQPYGCAVPLVYRYSSSLALAWLLLLPQFQSCGSKVLQLQKRMSVSQWKYRAAAADMMCILHQQPYLKTPVSSFVVAATKKTLHLFSAAKHVAVSQLQNRRHGGEASRLLVCSCKDL